jgi:alpha-L-fucosidase
MFYFEDRVGPDFGAEAPEYPDWTFPQWLKDAKFGIFVHWGLYSVPAFAETGNAPTPVEDAYRDHKYAEWYGNTVRLPGSSAEAYQRETFGPGTSYEDLAELWTAESFDANECVGLFRRAGARYVVPTAKHHDGFCLWDTETTGFNSVRRGPGRDLLAEFATAARDAGLKFGAYFSGALDWHVSDLRAINSDPDVFRLRRNDEQFARYAFDQVGELVDRFAPDILWNDIEWPDAGKSAADFGVAALFRKYLAAVPEGIVNDRWGVPSHGYLTREYSDIGSLSDKNWESCRGLGRSFGVNRNETESDVLSVAEIVRHLVSVVSRNGNLLLNIGLNADGTIPAIYRDRLEGLAAWMDVNGEAIYCTRPFAGDPLGREHVALTVGARATYVLVMDPAAELPVLPLPTTGGHWLGASEAGDKFVVPETLKDSAVAVFAIPHTNKQGHPV